MTVDGANHRGPRIKRSSVRAGPDHLRDVSATRLFLIAHERVGEDRRKVQVGHPHTIGCPTLDLNPRLVSLRFGCPLPITTVGVRDVRTPHRPVASAS